MDLRNRQFTTADVINVTCLTMVVLQTWGSRGLIKAIAQKPGYGQRRLYSAEDVLRLAIMKHLTQLGVSASDAAQICEVIDIDRLVSPDDPAPWVLVMNNGGRYAWFQDLGTQSLIARMRREQGYVCLLVDGGMLASKVIKDLKERETAGNGGVLNDEL